MKTYGARYVALAAAHATPRELMLDRDARYVLRLVPIDELDPPYEDVDDRGYVARLIKMFRIVGYTAAPIIWDGPGYGMPDGNHRHLAARRARLSHVPAFVRVTS